MKKAKIKSPSYFTEETEAALIQGLYDGTIHVLAQPFRPNLRDWK